MLSLLPIVLCLLCLLLLLRGFVCFVCIRLIFAFETSGFLFILSLFYVGLNLVVGFLGKKVFKVGAFAKKFRVLFFQDIWVAMSRSLCV